MIKLKIGNITQHIKQITFPAGEVGVEIQYHARAEEVEKVQILAYLKNSDDVMSLLLVNDAVDRKYKNAKKELKLNYTPYARQDRVCNEGESLSISVFANLINSCGFSTVVIADPHSDVTSALIKNVDVLESFDILKKKDFSNYYIVAPDAGAYKKAHKWARYKNALGVICANKVRNVQTGKIESVKVDSDVTGLNLLVVDDIAEGCATFLGLADALVGANRLEIFVTHGIFSKGIEKMSEKYDKIYTTNSYYGEVPENLKGEKIEWIML
jgi:ribose-phosphate pyrophosphokinase